MTADPTKPPRRIEVLAIGDELLDGRVLDQNGQSLAQALGALGHTVAQSTTVPDDETVIIAAANDIAGRGTDLCVVSGGLGPTTDDLTREAMARWLGVGIAQDDAWLAHLKERFAARGLPFAENQAHQAQYPQGADVIGNPAGMALGFAMTVRGCRFVCLPGVPSEYQAMLDAAVLVPLRAAGAARLRHELRTFGLIEGEVDRRLQPLGQRWPGLRLGYRTYFPEIHITLSTEQSDAALLQEAVAETRALLAPCVFTERGESLAECVLNLLGAHHATLCTAESCTGGLLSDLLTDVPGSSTAFLGGVVSYANSAKVELLGVSEATLATHGAVSEETVLAMARGAQARFGADYALATSGVAGPGGGTPQKPVGTVWLAAVGPRWQVTKMLSLPFVRRRNKVSSAHHALDLLRQHLLAQPTNERHP